MPLHKALSVCSLHAEPLAKLMDISSLGQITEGMEVAVTVPALGDREFRGKVTVKGISASVLSHSYSCTLIPDGKVTGLLPGMVCKVSVGKSGSGSLGTADQAS